MFRHSRSEKISGTSGKHLESAQRLESALGARRAEAGVPRFRQHGMMLGRPEAVGGKRPASGDYREVSPSDLPQRSINIDSHY